MACFAVGVQPASCVHGPIKLITGLGHATTRADFGLQGVGVRHSEWWWIGVLEAFWIDNQCIFTGAVYLLKAALEQHLCFKGGASRRTMVYMFYINEIHNSPPLLALRNLSSSLLLRAWLTPLLLAYGGALGGCSCVAVHTCQGGMPVVFPRTHSQHTPGGVSLAGTYASDAPPRSSTSLTLAMGAAM